MSETHLSIPLDQLVGLAVEHWRLSTLLDDKKTVPISFALRKIEEFLRFSGLETRSLNGQPYDPGLSARVVDTIDDRSLVGDAAIIAETLSPMILHRGAVVRSADIVIARNPD